MPTDTPPIPHWNTYLSVYGQDFSFLDEIFGLFGHDRHNDNPRVNNGNNDETRNDGYSSPPILEEGRQYSVGELAQILGELLARTNDTQIQFAQVQVRSHGTQLENVHKQERTNTQEWAKAWADAQGGKKKASILRWVTTSLGLGGAIGGVIGGIVLTCLLGPVGLVMLGLSVVALVSASSNLPDQVHQETGGKNPDSWSPMVLITQELAKTLKQQHGMSDQDADLASKMIMGAVVVAVMLSGAGLSVLACDPGFLAQGMGATVAKIAQADNKRRHQSDEETEKKVEEAEMISTVVFQAAIAATQLVAMGAGAGSLGMVAQGFQRAIRLYQLMSTVIQTFSTITTDACNIANAVVEIDTAQAEREAQEVQADSKELAARITQITALQQALIELLQNLLDGGGRIWETVTEMAREHIRHTDTVVTNLLSPHA